MRRLLAALVLSSELSALSFAASGGTTAAEFLRLGAGWPAGMSEAGGSTARDGTALHWNPAGIAGLYFPELYASHASLPETLSSDFASAVYPFADGAALGYSLQMLRQGSLDKLDNAGNDQGSFNALDMAHTVGFALRRDRNRFGAGLRYVTQTIDGTSGSALAADLGWQRDFERFSVGLSAANLGQKLKLGSEEYPLPMTLRGGGTWTGLRGDLLLAGDVSSSKGAGTRLHVGAAFQLYKIREVPAARPRGNVTLRAGYTAGGAQDSDGPSGLAGGAGVSYDALRADLTFQPFGKFGDAITLGLGYSFR